MRYGTFRDWWQDIWQFIGEVKYGSLLSQFWALTEEVDYGEWCGTVWAQWLRLAFKKVRKSQNCMAKAEEWNITSMWWEVEGAVCQKVGVGSKVCCLFVGGTSDQICDQRLWIRSRVMLRRSVWWVISESNGEELGGLFASSICCFVSLDSFAPQNPNHLLVGEPMLVCISRDGFDRTCCVEEYNDIKARVVAKVSMQFS